MKSRKQFKIDDSIDITQKTEERNINRNARNSEDMTTDDYDEEKGFTNKKLSDHDFRKKYKTEICKFWSINQTCKFGDKVNIKITLVCICSWNWRNEGKKSNNIKL